MPGFPSQPQQTCNALNTPSKSLHHPPCSPFTTGLPVPEPSITWDHGGGIQAAAARMVLQPQEPLQQTQQLRASSTCWRQLPLSPQTSSGPAWGFGIPQLGNARSAGFLPDFQVLVLLQLTGTYKRRQGTFSGSPGVRSVQQCNN